MLKNRQMGQHRVECNLDNDLNTFDQHTWYLNFEKNNRVFAPCVILYTINNMLKKQNSDWMQSTYTPAVTYVQDPILEILCSRASCHCTREHTHAIVNVKAVLAIQIKKQDSYIIFGVKMLTNWSNFTITIPWGTLQTSEHLHSPW